MKQGIAPKMLIVDGRQSPCLCHDNIICEYCVQANLILWERAENERNNKKGRAGVLLDTFKKLEKGRLAAMLGVSTGTIYKWLNSKEIPERYARKFYRKFPQGVVLKGSENQGTNTGLST